MRMYKACIDKQCSSKGLMQSIDNFPKSKGHKGGLAPYCKACKNRAIREERETEVKRLSNDEWLINFVKYKLSMGFVFIHDGFEYVKSSNDQAWLERTIRNG